MIIIFLYKAAITYNYKSTSALIIAKNLGGVFTLGNLFRIIPASLRDFIYDYIAKNRYKWYGKQESCMLPTEELKSKFLE